MELSTALSGLPASLQKSAQQALERLQEASEISTLSQRQFNLLVKGLGLSPFVAEVLQRRPELIVNLLDAGSPLFCGRNESQMRELLAPQVQACETEEQLMAVLRQFRNAEQARIVWRDMCDLGTESSRLDSTLSEASALADVCIQQAIEWLHLKLSERHGVPRDREGGEQQMIVLGMGKLGAKELNVSSDIEYLRHHELE